jgi:seryl-tRNA synthetase
VLDIKLIRQQPDEVRAALARRDPGLADTVDAILEQDRQWRAAAGKAEKLRSRQRIAGLTQAYVSHKGEPSPSLRAELKRLSTTVKEQGELASRTRAKLNELLLPLPNLPDPSAAPGPDDELVRKGGSVRAFDFPVRDHLQLAGPMIDVESATRLSGARFAYLLGDLVLVELALVRWVLELLRGRGFEPVIPPVLVREQALFGTGFLPDTEQQIYSLPEDELYLVGTSEVALASLHADEILEAERLPLRYAGFSPLSP